MTHQPFTVNSQSENSKGKSGGVSQATNERWENKSTINSLLNLGYA